MARDVRLALPGSPDEGAHTAFALTQQPEDLNPHRIREDLAEVRVEFVEGPVAKARRGGAQATTARPTIPWKFPDASREEWGVQWKL